MYGCCRSEYIASPEALANPRQLQRMAFYGFMREAMAVRMLRHDATSLDTNAGHTILGDSVV